MVVPVPPEIESADTIRLPACELRGTSGGIGAEEQAHAAAHLAQPVTQPSSGGGGGEHGGGSAVLNSISGLLRTLTPRGGASECQLRGGKRDAMPEACAEVDAAGDAKSEERGGTEEALCATSLPATSQHWLSVCDHSHCDHSQSPTDRSADAPSQRDLLGACRRLDWGASGRGVGGGEPRGEQTFKNAHRSWDRLAEVEA